MATATAMFVCSVPFNVGELIAHAVAFFFFLYLCDYEEEMEQPSSVHT